MSEGRIYLSPPHMGGNELKFVQEAFSTNWISPAGPSLGKFETELSNYCGVAHGVALASGTAAIHLSLIELGVKVGDEVICSSFTFAGSCNPVAYLGATPVFVDSERLTWNMDPALLEQAIEDRIRNGKKPAAIIMVHLYGMPARIDSIMEISKKHNVPVIEDAAEALGSRFKGNKLGSFGDIGVFSFNGNKIITTSGGGAMVSVRQDWIDHARFLSTQARDDAPHYEHTQIGYNYRLSNVCAAIGRGQLEVLERRITERRDVYSYYKKQLGGHAEFIGEPTDSFSNRWLTTVLFPNFAIREKVRLGLTSVNIESRPLWKPMHMQPVFSMAPAFSNGVAQGLFERGLCLPSGSNLSKNDQDRVVATVVESLRNA